MNVKIAGQSTKTNYQNTGSSAPAVFYDEHDLREYSSMSDELHIKPQDLMFFDMCGHVVSGEEVQSKIDRFRAGLHANDTKFFVLMIDPSDDEISAMGDTLESQLHEGQKYVYSLMDAYAKNFHRDGVSNRHDLVAYAIPHLYKGEEKKSQIHWHVIVSRKDASNKYKLSPMTHHRNTKSGCVVGGFDRESFVRTCEQIFDFQFGYKRRVEESFDYCLATLKGSPEEKRVQADRLARQNLIGLETALEAAAERLRAKKEEPLAENDPMYIPDIDFDKSYYGHSAIKDMEEIMDAPTETVQEEVRNSAHMQEMADARSERNRFWNTYHTYYRPLVAKTKEVCRDAFSLYEEVRQKYASQSREVSEAYRQLKLIYGRIDDNERAIAMATTARGVAVAVAALVALINPVAGLVIGLIGRLAASTERTVRIDDNRALRHQARAVRDKLSWMIVTQKDLKTKKDDCLKYYLDDKAELSKLRKEILYARATLDGFAVLKSNGNYILVDARENRIGTGAFLEVGKMTDDGMALVRCLDGTYNYVDRAGGLLSRTGFDLAKPFVKGHAKVMVNGRPYVIDNKGAVLKTEPEVVQKPSPTPSGIKFKR